MRGWYRLYEDYAHDHGIVAQPAMHDASVLEGRPIDAIGLPPLEFELEAPDDGWLPHFMTGGTVLASDAFISTLRAAGVGNLQCFPVRLSVRGTGTVRHDYRLFNVLGRRGPGAAGDAEAADAGSLHMYRLADIPADLVVDDVVREALATHRPTGGWGIVLEALD